MALPVRQQLTYWSIALVVLLAVLWGLGSVILPFILGGALAYFMDPVADRLQRLGLSRTWSTLVIALLLAAVFVVIGLLVLPTLIRQTVQLVETAPDIAARLQGFLTAQFPAIMVEGSVVRDTLISIGEAIKSQGGALVSGVLTSAMSVLNAIIFAVVVPVVAFYMLLDWDHMVARIDALLPREHAPVIRDLARDIDRAMAGFLRGQVSVCLILGSFYAIMLMLAGLQFGLVVGAFAGAITFIPYVGALIGGALALGLALFQFWGDWVSIGVVAGIFVLGQFLEGNVFTPRLVGSSVGLHPLWLIFALSALGSVFGFVGLLVAVPIAAMVGVLVRFGIERYKESRLYTGQVKDGPPAPKEGM